MITNLVFKRTVNIEGSNRTEMKIVEINVPEIKASEGWTLVSSADKVTMSPRVTGEKAVSNVAEYELGKELEDKEVDITENRDADPDKATDFLNNLIVGVSQTNANTVAECNCLNAQTDKDALDRFKRLAAAQSVNVAYKPEDEPKPVDVRKEMEKLEEYPSSVPGTACLIRKNGEIKIAYRKGKKANMNTPNRICINDADKQSFFNAVRADNGGRGEIRDWKLVHREGIFDKYDTWNAFMDEEYILRKNEYIRKNKK